MLNAIFDLLIGIPLLLNLVPKWVWDFAWHSWAGYIWRNAPDPDPSFLRGAGGVFVAAGVARIINFFFFDPANPGWLINSLDSVGLICLFLAFFVPWVAPFRKHERDRQWKEMVPKSKDQEN